MVCHPMKCVVRLLAVIALFWGVGLAPARAWQSGARDPALIDLAPQSYPVPDVPRDIPSDAPPPDAGSGLLYHDLSLASLAGDPLDGTGLRWFGDLATPSPRQEWAPLASTGLDTWTLGTRNWRYDSTAGYGLTLGNTAAGTPAGGRAVRLAGVGLSRTRTPGRLAAGQWDYAVAAGAVDGAPSATPVEGGLAYGPMALDATTRYAPADQFTLASRVQSTQGLTALGLGGDYAMGDVGVWRFGVSGSRSPENQGWRRRLAYTVDLSPNLGLTWINAQQGAGYTDLAAYAGDAGCDCISNQWQLDLAAGQWGAISGSFERRVDLAGSLDERVGLRHGFRYGPYLRVQLETNRDLISGDYGVGARISLPLGW